MKAVIVEIRGKQAAALSDDGCITQLKDNHYAVGQVIQMKKRTAKFYAKLAACAAGVILAVGTGITAWAYYTPYYYVSLDVNPSIEYSVNRFDRVLESSAVNDDGQRILQNVDVTNKSIGEAVQTTVQEIAQQGYIPESGLGGIVITTSSKDDSKSEQLAAELKEDAEKAIQEQGLEAQVEAQGVGQQRVEEAKAMGVTPGKLNLVQKLQASMPDQEIDIQEWLTQPVKNIMKAIKENTAEEKAEEKVQKQQQEVTQPEDAKSNESQVQTQKNGASSDESKKSENAQNENGQGNSSQQDKNETKVPNQNANENAVKNQEKAGNPVDSQTSSTTTDSDKANEKNDGQVKNNEQVKANAAKTDGTVTDSSTTEEKNNGQANAAKTENQKQNNGAAKKTS